MSDLLQRLNKRFGIKLPELLHGASDPGTWEERRREIREQFQTHVYGRFPAYNPADTKWVERQTVVLPTGGNSRTDYTLTVPMGGGEFSYDMELYLPARANGPVPVFLFITSDHWALLHVKNGTINEYFPLKYILHSGFGIACVDVMQLAADDADAFFSDNGFRSLLRDTGEPNERLGALGIWAFGAMRVMDVLAQNSRVDATKVSVIGLSRLGKTALVAGAFDDRFAMTVSVNSGQGGAALSMLKEGESLKGITAAFPHWFCANYSDYGERPDTLPVDQHALLALVAPRLLYITSSEQDSWADPVSEFRSAKLASAVYSTVYGMQGLEIEGDDWDAIDTGRLYQDGQVAYHRRVGEHGLNRFDWGAVVVFAEKKFKLK